MPVQMVCRRFRPKAQDLQLADIDLGDENLTLGE